MDPNHLYYHLQPASFSPPGPQLPYQLPSTVYPGTHPYHGGYNTDWGLAQQQALLDNANIMMGGGPSTAGPVATNNNSGYQCRWLTGVTPCGQGFATYDDLMVHLGRVHDVQGCAARVLVCRWWSERGYCGQEYRRDGFRRHIATHVGCSVPCPECGKSFSRKDSMRSHSKKQHGKK